MFKFTLTKSALRPAARNGESSAVNLISERTIPVRSEDREKGASFYTIFSFGILSLTQTS